MNTPKTAEEQSQIEELRRATQRMDGSRYTDRLVVLVHQAKKILAGFDAERTKRLQAEHERDCAVERVYCLKELLRTILATGCLDDHPLKAEVAEDAKAADDVPARLCPKCGAINAAECRCSPDEQWDASASPRTTEQS